MQDQDHSRLIVVDADRLDREWVDQSRLIFEYSEAEADARHEHAQAKAQLELVEAELTLAVRVNPKKYSIPEKATEAVYKAAVIRSRRYQAALANLNNLKRVLDRFGNAVSALEHKKKALEKLVELEAINYHSTPRLNGRSVGYERAEEIKTRSARRGFQLEAKE